MVYSPAPEFTLGQVVRVSPGRRNEALNSQSAIYHRHSPIIAACPPPADPLPHRRPRPDFPAAYFAIRGGMTSPVTGEPTHAVFAFAGMLLKFLPRVPAPRQYVAMPIDTPGKTFRDEMYADYKATRSPTPEDFFSQEQRIFEMARMFGLPVFGLPGVEADDIIATIVERVLAREDLAEMDIRIRLGATSSDLGQAPRRAGDDVRHPHRHRHRRRGAAGGQGRDARDQVVDLLTLTGDSADNIPGVPGVGPKTAAKLLQQFGSLDANSAKPRQTFRQVAREFSPRPRSIPGSSSQRRLVTLKRDCDIAVFAGRTRRIGRGRCGRPACRLVQGDGIPHRHLNDLEPPAREFRTSPSCPPEANRHQSVRLRRGAERRRAAVGGESVEIGGKTVSVDDTSRGAGARVVCGDALFDAGPREPALTDWRSPRGVTGARLPRQSTRRAADCQYEAVTTAEEAPRAGGGTLRKLPGGCISVDTGDHRAGASGDDLRAQSGVAAQAWGLHPAPVARCRSTPGRQGGIRNPRPAAGGRGRQKNRAQRQVRPDGAPRGRHVDFLRGVVFDSMIAAHLLDAAAGLGLDALARCVAPA